MGFNITGISTVLVAVEDIDAAVETFSEGWGLKLDKRNESEELGIKMAYFPVGDTTLELVTPGNDEDGNLLRLQLDRRGEGLYMMSFEVDDIKAAVAELREKGFNVTDPAGDEVLEAFVSPKAAHGVRLVLVQR